MLSSIKCTFIKPASLSRSVYMYVGPHANREAAAHTVLRVTEDDTASNRPRHHETRGQKRKRKKEEQAIRHSNRDVGSMIEHILQQRKSDLE